MKFHTKSCEQVLKELSSNKTTGLTSSLATQNLNKYGENKLSKQKNKSLFVKIINSLCEPMMLILIFSLVIALGSSIGQFFKTGEADFAECFGILGAIVLSCSITLIMEGSSQKAFSALNSIYDNTSVKVIRDGQVLLISRQFLTIGDIVLIEGGDKIVADGRLVETNNLTTNESALTGESQNCEKQADLIFNTGTPLAERKNMVYSGTFVTSGNGKMVVTSIGDNTEIGGIARELKEEKQTLSPLETKLAKLGKVITLIGFSVALLVFILSVFRLYFTNELTFNNVQEIFISSVILIVAAVPEGLPTIVAVSLALNMIKLAKENALIKKMVASESAGAVSVICSDKTGTLTQNKMRVESICTGSLCYYTNDNLSEYLLENFICNSTAKVINKGGKKIYFGNGTECALLECVCSKDNRNYQEYKQKYKVVEREPFSSQNKYMFTSILVDGEVRKLLKGAPEKVIPLCNLSKEQKRKILFQIEKEQNRARRILAFAHSEKDQFVFDGFVCIVDPIRKEVKKAVEECKRAQIKVKMLTGDNFLTAYSVAKELKIADNENQVINGYELEKMNDETLKKALKIVNVVARSTPILKLRIVKALKEMGEVVAVTGDGINDAPAIRHADVGIAMGKSGSEITKEASDIILLDDSFSTVVRAIAFGRNVYKNLQRFILFQLSVNLSALLFITVMVLLGHEAPFSTFELLWINVIMDGPPALTLGLEGASKNLMRVKPVRRTASIVSKGMLVRIIFNALFIGTIMVLQERLNFLGAKQNQRNNATFTLFIVFQLFNAFNSRELGERSIFSSVGKNKVMLLTFFVVFLLQVMISQVFPSLFGLEKMEFVLWIKIIFLSSSIIVITELAKAVYRLKIHKKITFFSNRTSKIKSSL